MRASIVALYVSASGLFVLAVVYLYGRFGRRLHGPPSSAVQPVPDQTEIDRLSGPLLQDHAGENAITLIADNMDAFALRAASARRAGRSLDLQYYYWKNDLTGRMLAREVLDAADRGVRVRLLLDDINAGLHDRMCLSLDAHEHIEVRLFNPSRARTDRFKRGLEMMLRPLRASRRMHNKQWIADGRVVIAGGRNIGDAYFDADEQSNFRDLDVWMLGPVADEAAAVFDRYWNSSVVVPIGSLRTPRKHYLPNFRSKLERVAASKGGQFYLGHVEAVVNEGGLLPADMTCHWTGEAQLVSDPPEKAFLQKRSHSIMRELMPVLTSARRDVRVISPYFIPGTIGTIEIGKLVDRQVNVAVLTNSLAATDVAAVHGAYANYRKALLKSGTALFELKAVHDATDQKRMSLFGSRGASLHTKAFTVDGKSGFVGSMNFDPRSASLNTEMGVLFTHPALVAEVEAIFDEETSPANSFRLTLERNRLRWHDIDGETPRVLKHEPEAGFWRRLLAGIIGILPIESQL
ncbi:MULTISPECIES: phospholipase D family protein [unclassified Rhizobium]|uniref:phospholipase D family protein n=1 Tax=unclassified Rhizobium TaxID=2613769 RepID=UPI000715B400|nr:MULTISPECIES: phospholipase D family protein [unclassified Rhizobium]KQS93899.1 cardiolipin synthase [Rhizobium sp. Leaf386]KQT06585.1 cardiolipin synthase [Rhizobium sp. Leaf391]KQU05014.1 cardiolipin synthase [Rhizobium sp. Leaf453]